MDSAALERLARSINGEVITPDHPAYDAARVPARQPAGDIRPAAIVRCADEAAVVATLALARDTGMPIVPRAGGHCFAGSSTSTGIVLDLSPMDSVVVDGSVAVLGAGVRLAQAYTELGAAGRALPLGCGPTVGIAGLTFGGGLGLLGRRYGLTCDRLLGARVVLADGSAVECDADHEPDLLWALRGAGGGCVGMVTSLTYDTVPDDDVTGFVVRWPEDAAETAVLHWQEWAPDAPDDLSCELLLVAGPDAMEAVGFGAVTASRERAEEYVDGFCDAVGHAPSSRRLGTAPVSVSKTSYAGLGGPADDSWPWRSRSEIFDRSLPADAVRGLLDLVTTDRPAGGHRELSLMALGGAYNAVDPAATAFAHRRDRFTVEHASSHPDGDPTGWADRSWAYLHPHATGRVYPNFPVPGQPRFGPVHLGANAGRLREIRRAYDPQGLFGAA